GCARERADLAVVVFVRALGVDRLAGREGDIDPEPPDPNTLRPLADEVHLDPAFVLGVDRTVREAIEVERRIELAIDALQDVLVESGGDAAGVVVGGFEGALVLS